MQFGLFTHLPWPENTVPRRLIEEITGNFAYPPEKVYSSSDSQG